MTQQHTVPSPHFARTHAAFPFSFHGFSFPLRGVAKATQLLCASAVMFGAAAPAHAQAGRAAAPATATEARHRYAIPTGLLGPALNRLGRESGALITFAPELVAGVRTPGANGSLTVAQALNALLVGSGLVPVTGQGGAYSVRRAANTGQSTAAASTSLAEVNVTAQAERNPTTEGTGSYVATGPISTATPLGLSLKETPQTVSVMTSQRMEDQGLTTLQQTLAQVPGITLFSLGTERAGITSRGYAITNYQLDGVSTHSENLGLDALPSQSLADMALYDRIEVLRGASGLMTGAGDPSGAVNMVRKKPTAAFQGSAEVEVGSWNNRRGVLDLSGPLNQAGSVRGRVVAIAQDSDSYIDNYSRNKQVLYGVIEADMTDSTKVTIGLEGQNNKSKGSFSYLGFPLFYSNGEQTDLPRSFSAASRGNFFSTDSKSAFVTIDQALANDWQLKFSANQLRSSQEEQSVYLDVSGGFADKATGDGLLLNANRRDYRLRVNSLDVNVRGPVSLFGRTHELVFGADYSDFKSETVGSFDWNVQGTAANLYTWDRSASPVFGDPYVTYNSTRRQASLYAAGRLEIADQLKLIVGAKALRYDENYITDAPTVDYYSASPASESHVFTPYGGLVYNINRQHTAYASYATIYQPQAAQDRNGALLAPREGASTELGLKSSFAEGQLNTAFALYQIRQDNLSETDPGYYVPGTTNAASRAIKGAKTQGFDAEVSGALTRQWNVSASYGYSTSEDATGQRITTTFPKHLVKLWSTYRLPGDWRRLTLGGGVNWQSKVYSDIEAWQIDQTLHWKQNAYAVANLMARYDFSEQLSAVLNVNNVFDKKYTTSISGWWYSGMYGAPRSASLNVKYRF